MKFNNWTREQITKRATDSVFDPKKGALKEREGKLALEVRNRLIPKRYRDVIDALPLEYFFYERGHFMNITVDGNSDDYIRLFYPAEARMPANLRGDITVLIDSKAHPALAEKLLKLKQDWADHLKDRNEFQARLRGTLNAIPNSEKLKELMPDVFVLMGEFFEKNGVVVRNLPVEAINTINAQVATAIAQAAA